jgi:hypothetical protein
MGPAGPMNTGVPRMGDVAEIARRTERLDEVSRRLTALESKTDKILEIVLSLRPGSIPTTRGRKS